MARLLGIDIPDNKRGAISLTYIFGIGRNLSLTILQKANVDYNKKVKDWSDQDFQNVRSVVNDSDIVIEGELRSEIRTNKKRLKDIGCYRGIRDRKGLPNRGQKTKNNARTKKGKRKTITNKKKIGK